VIAPAVGIVWTTVEGIFSGQDKFLPALTHELTEEPLTRAIGVEIGRIDEIAAGIDKDIEDPFTLLFRGTKRPVFTEDHGAETELGNAQA